MKAGKKILIARLHLWHDNVVPVRQGALNRELEGLAVGELCVGGSTLVPLVLPDGFIVGMVSLHGRGRDIKAPPPDLNLLLAVLGGGLRLVEAGQPAVMPLVEPPGLLDGQVGLTALLQHGGKSLLRPGEQRSVGNIEGEPSILERLAAGLGLLHALLAQVRVEPAAELVLLVPLALPVSDHDNLVGRHLYADFPEEGHSLL